MDVAAERLSAPSGRAPALRIDRRELAGAVADIGVLLPIAATLIVANGLSATAVLLPAALLYLTVSRVYGLPIPVQPLKAFGAIAIAKGLGVGDIASGALLMGVTFIVLGRTGLLDRVARVFPRPLIRGVQLAVGLLFLKIAWGLVSDPPAAFADHAIAVAPAVALGGLALALLLVFRQRSASLVLVAVGVVVMLATTASDLSFGPSPIELPPIDGASLLTALTVLVIPQIPLTFANSCLGTADAARVYFGERAERVLPGRLATTLGAANVAAAGIGGMPVCHGAGGLTAHHKFGARGAGAPAVMGTLLLILALALGGSLAVLLAAFPLPILAALLAAAGILHIGLLADLRSPPTLALAVAVGVTGFLLNLAIALGAGLAVWWLVTFFQRRR